MDLVSPRQHKHSRSLPEKELLKSFPDLEDRETKIVRHIFSDNICVENFPKTMHNEFLELRSDLFVKDSFEERSVTKF